MKFYKADVANATEADWRLGPVRGIGSVESNSKKDYCPVGTKLRDQHMNKFWKNILPREIKVSDLKKVDTL